MHGKPSLCIIHPQRCNCGGKNSRRSFRQCRQVCYAWKHPLVLSWQLLCQQQLSKYPFTKTTEDFPKALAITSHFPPLEEIVAVTCNVINFTKSCKAEEDLNKQEHHRKAHSARCPHDVLVRAKRVRASFSTQNTSCSSGAQQEGRQGLLGESLLKAAQQRPARYVRSFKSSLCGNPNKTWRDGGSKKIPFAHHSAHVTAACMWQQGQADVWDSPQLDGQCCGIGA